MNTATDPNGPADTRVMGIVHSALRRDLVRARCALTERPYPFDAQRVAIADHLIWMMSFLRDHHRSEDAHLYPLVRERNREARALLDDMDQDHRSIVPAMEALERAAAGYRDSADARGEVVAAVDVLSESLLPHLEREEREMMPVVSATITDTEWRQWDEEYNIKSKGPIELFDEGLFIVDSAEPDDARAIAELVPPIPRWLMLNVMIRRYRAGAFRRWRTPQFSPLRAQLRGCSETTSTARPTMVWAVLADVTRVGEWSHECRRARWLHGATSFRVLSLPRWFDRMISLTVPAHHDRGNALHGDLVRLARLAERDQEPGPHRLPNIEASTHRSQYPSNREHAEIPADVADKRMGITRPIAGRLYVGTLRGEEPRR
ncbi:MAG: hemerythrin domain-containing protein [Rhodococcus sp. (in: high G+C Gram-positive bacteria)]|nr:MAG: hemerythrin domain-containing protein [Rhodococcus sp. (in: high G+C Gram-positive bacteria)]